MLSSLDLAFKIAIICTQCHLSITAPSSITLAVSVHPMAIFPDSWAPSFILGFSCIVVVTISALGTGIYLFYARHIRPCIQARKAARLRRASGFKAVDKEKKVEHNTLPYSNVPANPFAAWPALMPPQPAPEIRPPEPRLPWPVLAVLPSLRPKDPVHVRMKNAVMLRNKEEVKVRFLLLYRALHSWLEL